MQASKHVVIIGATSAMAEHCARLWLEQGIKHFSLVGRNAERVQRVANDLQVRMPDAEIRVIESDFLKPEAIAQTVRNIAEYGAMDIVLIAQGWLSDQAQCQTDLALCRATLEVNALSPVLFAEAVVSEMEKQGKGVLALIGSVAGDRGRRSNYVYGAAKGLLERYAQGLQHRFAGTAIKVVLIKPGPTETAMTAHLKGKGLKFAKVERVAQGIVRAIERAQAVAYVPRKWRWIMWVIRRLPSFVFKRLSL